MKRFGARLLIILVCSPLLGIAQSTPDSLYNELKISRGKHRIDVLIELARFYHGTNLDSSINLTTKALEVAGDDASKQIPVFIEFGRIKILSASFEEALDYLLKAENLCKTDAPDDQNSLMRVYSHLGIVYERRGEIEKAIQYFEKAIVLLDQLTVSKVPGKLESTVAYAGLYNNFANALIKAGDTARAVLFQKKGLTYALQNNDYAQASILYNNVGKTLIEQHKVKDAYPYLLNGMKLRKKIKDLRGLAWSFRNMGLYHLNAGNNDSARYYVKQSFATAEEVGDLLDSFDAGYLLLSEIFERSNKFDSALWAFKHHIEYRDSVYSGPRFKELARVEAKYEMLKKTQQEVQARSAREFKIILIIGGLIVGLALITLLYVVQKYRSNNQRLRLEQLQVREEKLVSDHQVLNLELDYKKKDLATHVLFLLKKDELISKIVQKLLAFRKDLGAENQQQIIKITRELKNILGRNDNSWQEFELRFKEIHNDFYEKLEASHPELTPKERRLCALLKLNMTTKEISSITHQSTRSIDVARTRLRKKFNLTNSEVGLVDFLSKY